LSPRRFFVEALGTSLPLRREMEVRNEILDNRSRSNRPLRAREE
jgi:hypothetical protein